MKEFIKLARIFPAYVFIAGILAGWGFPGIRQAPSDSAVGGNGTGCREQGSRATLDSASDSCLRCHDVRLPSIREVMNPDITGKEAGEDGWTGHHPIGMDYDACRSKSPGTLISLRQLNPGIRLTDGRIGCLSCHEMREHAVDDAQPPSADTSAGGSGDCLASGRLTVAGSATDLCLSCHVK